ncbi:MAG: geranylgeranyl reductase family protein [Candidatus Nanopelagicales bacterium]|jgi:geranylgeranyl reductase family protein|nr:geranylgeranyl reductase family protein [Candidatus Nanopelagicales bacterium]
MAVHDAEVIVVGAGPAGSATAHRLAAAGRDVLLLEKARFPRDKVCGDGLTPRAVQSLIGMGVDISPEAGWARNRGLRIIANGRTYELPWPQLERFPDFGLVRSRMELDELLARHAAKAGARLEEGVKVLAPTRDERTGRVTGVLAQPVDERGRASGSRVRYTAPVVVAADGVSSRMSVASGIGRRDDRPMGVAVRAYAPSPRAAEPWMESWLELRSDGALLPGYGWVFGLADGTVNIGLGILNTSDAFQNVDYRDHLRRWMRETPEHWALRQHADTVAIKGMALPMGFNRQPHYARGLLLVGDAGGMVNPFNGEGIDYALEAGALAGARVDAALAEPRAEGREVQLHGYAQDLKAHYGGYYTLGRWFVRAIGHPSVMKLATTYGMPVPVLRELALKLMANLTDVESPDAMDRLVNALSRIAPAA